MPETANFLTGRMCGGAASGQVVPTTMYYFGSIFVHVVHVIFFM